MNELLEALGMTKEKAISNLEHVIASDEDIDFFTVDEKMAMKLAISALKGGWIPIESIEDIPKSGGIWATIQFDGREPDVEWFIWSEAFKQWVYEEDGYPITYHAMKAITAYMPHTEPEPYKKGD